MPYTEASELTERSTSLRPQSFTEKLQGEKAGLEKRLKEINAVLSKLEKQPEMQDLLDSIHKLNLRF